MTDPKPLPADARDPITMGEIAYNAYRKHSGGKSLVSGAPIPQWRYVADEIRAAWNAAGDAAADRYRRERDDLAAGIREYAAANAEPMLDPREAVDRQIAAWDKIKPILDRCEPPA